MATLVALLVLSAAIWLTATVLPGVQIKGFGTAIGVAVVFSVLNFLFGWLLFGLIGIGTLGLGFLLYFITQWVVNAILLYATDKLFSSFHIQSFAWAMVASLVISAFASVGQWIIS